MNKLLTEFSTPLIWEEIKEYFGAIPLLIGKNANWRMRAKLAVRGTFSNPKIGLFKPGTHEVEDLSDCPDHHQSINEAISLVRKALRKCEISPYNEQTVQGDLRYLQFITERSTKKVQLTLVANGKSSLSKIQALADFLWESGSWHSIWINVQEGSTNTIFGPSWIHCQGPKTLKQKLLHHMIDFHPASFMQAHLDLFEKILLDIRANLLPNKKVIEFYAGVGAIGLCLADKCASLTLIEINPFAKPCFEKSDPPSYLHYITGATKEYAHLIQDHEVLIIDPPRKGLDPQLKEAIKESSLKQILYLSCNFVTLKQDLEELKQAGFEIESARGYYLFPNTNHIEVLVNLKKSG